MNVFTCLICKAKRNLWLVVPLVLGIFGNASAQPVTVAAASSVRFVLPELVEQFKSQTGHSVRAVYGSSGSLTHQALYGAPFDVFLP
ncbi:MAG: substrate-binding domain-containing protein, partial [Limnobacter sp.]|nr:substrate-binding domain-containing protein [Limnobacter sp.]